MTRQRYHAPVRSEPFVSKHVQLGDFSQPVTSGQATSGSTNTRLLLDWYGERLDALRAALGVDMRAIVFSDGSDGELAALLARPNVERAPKQQSVTDLLDMGQGAALIASESGFSLWGAFLGGVPRIAFLDQSIGPIDPDPARDIESDLGEAIPQSFADQVRAGLVE